MLRQFFPMVILKKKFIWKYLKGFMILQIHIWCVNFSNHCMLTFLGYVNLFKHGTKYLTNISFLKDLKDLKQIQTFAVNQN